MAGWNIKFFEFNSKYQLSKSQTLFSIQVFSYDRFTISVNECYEDKLIIFFGKFVFPKKILYQK